MRERAVQEPMLARNHARLVAEMLTEAWALGPDEFPNIDYNPNRRGMQTGGRGFVFVSHRTDVPVPVTIDYAAVDITDHVVIRIDTFDMDRLFLWAGEVCRILMSYRREGYLGKYMYSEITIEGMTDSEDYVGQYERIIEVALVSRNVPLQTSGFRGGVNKSPSPSTRRGRLI